MQPVGNEEKASATNHFFGREEIPLVNTYKKATTPYSLRRFKNVMKAEEKVRTAKCFARES